MDNYAQKPIHPLEQPPPPPPVRPEPTGARRVAFPQTKPILTYVILGINVAVFLADMALHNQLTLLGDKNNIAIMQGELWRLFTPMFLHANLIHLGVNSYSLYIVGPSVERSFGYSRFLALYILSGIASAITSFALGPYQSIGASGALFGLVGALLPLLYLNRKVLSNTNRQIGNIVVVIVLNLLFGVSIPGIDNWAHIGGLAGGLVLAWLTAPRYTVRFDMLDVVRIEDESSIQTAWLFYGLAALGLAAIVFVLINLRLAPTG
jgi:rhomboid protease GluP